MTSGTWASTATSNVFRISRLNSNQFSALDIDVDDDEFPMTAAEISTSSTKAPTRSAHEVFELDVAEESLEDAFELFCFFEDLHQIRDSISRTWQRLARGELSLRVATVITQSGIDIVRHLEKEMLNRRHRNEFDNKHPYLKRSLPPFYADTFLNGEDPEELLNSPKSLEHGSFHDFIFLPTAKTLLKFTSVVNKCKDIIMWLFPIPQMRFSYMVSPELLELPGYKKRVEDDELLTQLLLEVLWSRIVWQR